MNLSRISSDNSFAIGFGGYAVLGYDFGKLINPKDYESRMNNR